MNIHTDFYLLAIPANEDWTDPKVACGKSYGTLEYGSVSDALHLDVNVYTHLDSFKDRKTLERLADAVKNEMRKIEQEDKQAQFDKLVDEIAAEHREESKKKEKPVWFHDLINGKICIVFSALCEYSVFCLDYSDILLLPFCRDIYSSHPEIVENKWPVVIHSAGNPSSQESMTWSIAQSDYRKRRTISGLDWFEYDELEDYECAKSCNKNVWFVARAYRGKNAPAPGEDYGNGRNA